MRGWPVGGNGGHMCRNLRKLPTAVSQAAARALIEWTIGSEQYRHAAGHVALNGAALDCGRFAKYILPVAM